jgi:VWFA-related protein
MYFQVILHSAPPIWRIVCVVLISAVFTFSQTLEQEKPKIRNFGKSLEKKKNKSEDREIIQKTDDEDVIKVETNLVRTDVLVLDQNGRAVLGLKQEDFIITENDIPQEIAHFPIGESVDVPRSIVLIIDYSGSQEPFIETSVRAAKVLVDKLNPKDRMAIVTDDVKLLTGFTKDKELLKKNLDLLVKKVKSRNYGLSRQYSALMATLNELFDEEDIRPIIIFQTDGDEAFGISRSTPEGNKSNVRYSTTFTVEELFGSIEKSRATIYSVVSGSWLLDLSPEERVKTVGENWTKLYSFKQTPESLKNYAEMFARQQMSMVIAARASGGFTSRLEAPEQADAVYSGILEDINNRYLIGYYPTNLEKDGKRRNVKIEVRNHPEYIVWGRKTFLAPRQ